MTLSPFTILCNHHFCLVPEHSITPKGDPVPMSCHSPSPSSSPWQPLICLLSPCICPFWTFHIKGITQYVPRHCTHSTDFILLLFCLFACCWLWHMACWILVPQPGIEPEPPAMEARRPDQENFNKETEIMKRKQEEAVFSLLLSSLLLFGQVRFPGNSHGYRSRCLMFPRPLPSPPFHLLRAEPCPRNYYVEVLTPEWGCIWRWGLQRRDEGKMKSLGWVLIP